MITYPRKPRQHRRLRRTVPLLPLPGDALGFQQRDVFAQRRNRGGARDADVVGAGLPPVSQGGQHAPPFAAARQAGGDDGLERRALGPARNHLSSAAMPPDWAASAILL